MAKPYLDNNTYELPVYIIDTLKKEISKHDKNTLGYERCLNLIKSPTLSYPMMKKIKHFFDTYNPIKNNKEEYNLYGGGKMYSWVKRCLSVDRDKLHRQKKNKDSAGMENQYRRPHEKKFHRPQRVYSNKSSLTENIIKQNLETKYPNASVGIILLDQDNDFKNNVLLLKRRDNDDWMGGKWSLPGGGVEKNEDKLDALLREIKEETGLIINKGQSRFSFSKLENGNYVHFFILKTKQEDITLSDEHSDYNWVKLNDLKNYDTVPNLVNDIFKSIKSFKPH